MKATNQKLQRIFQANRTLKVLYVFPDGNIFSNLNYAQNHQRSCKHNMVVVKRDDLALISEQPEEKAPEQPDKSKEQEGEALTLNDQLLSIDLSKPKGMYSVLKPLHDGLGLKSPDAKLVTIAATLLSEQNRLKSLKSQ